MCRFGSHCSPALTRPCFRKSFRRSALTSKPEDQGELWGERLTRPWWQSIFSNLRDVFFPPKLPPLQLTSSPVEGENALDDDLALPWYRSLFTNVRNFPFPEKLPPLQLTSKPVAVRDIWGFYSHKKDGALASTGVHAVLIALLIGGTHVCAQGGHSDQADGAGDAAVVRGRYSRAYHLRRRRLVAVGWWRSRQTGGVQGKTSEVGHGAVHASDGRGPESENPKLPMEPTVVVPPQIKLAMNNMPNLGDPMATIPNGPLSNGTGSGGGIGSGSGGGVGSGEGPGVGPGKGGGIGGGVFHVGGGVSAPRAIFQPDPEYSEEARKAKYQGVVVLGLVVGPDGRPRDMRCCAALALVWMKRPSRQ